MKMAKIEDWKNYLAPESQNILAKILEDTKKHQGAYMNADDIKVAQLWSTIIELKKEIDSLKKAQIKLEEPFKSIVDIGNTEKEKAIERVLRDIMRPTDESSEEATKKLVDSLMKF